MNHLKLVTDVTYLSDRLEYKLVESVKGCVKCALFAGFFPSIYFIGKLLTELF